MRPRLPRPLLPAAAVFAFAPVARAQNPATGGSLPSPGQAQQLLQQRPDLIQQLQQRLLASGLTPDQVRDRLRAAGYPDNLIDQYLPGGSGRGAAGDTLSSTTLLNVMSTLGIADSLDVDALRADSTGRRDSTGARRGRYPSPSRIPTGARDFIVDTVPRSAITERYPDSTGTVIFVPLPGDSTRYIRRIVRRPSYGAAVDSLNPADTSRAARDSIRMARDSGLAIFGLDLFRNAGSTLFEPNLAGPVDRNYRLGPGDRLVLILTGDVEQSYNLQVTREGFVVIPQVGQLYVANLSLAQLDDLLYSRLGRVYSGVRRRGGTTQFAVSVARLRSLQVFVVGDVLRPGSYRVSSAGTALTALYAAGGPSDNGSLRRVEVRRDGRVVSTLDVYDYLTQGDASRDARLQDGDVVFVPPRLARVRALGEVLRPATYEVKPGETLADLVRVAGGFTALAAPRRITIERVLPPAERPRGGGGDRVVLDASAGAEGATVPALPLANGDIVRVARVAERVRDRVLVEGNVNSPGPVGLTAGMRLSDALRAAGGLKADTYLGQVLVSRMQRDSSRVQLRAVLRDLSGAVYNDLRLQEDDQVRVFSLTTFRPERYVAIGGAVRRGGRFKYYEGITLRDLMLLADGPTEGALLTEAEVARLPESRAGGATATTVRVPLDSTYLFGHDVRARGYVPGVQTASNGAPETVLQAYDNVLILRQPEFELQRTVFLGGEVRYPGRYALRRKTERLSDVLARAGGLTSDGYADGVVFYRSRGNTGRIGIDLPNVLRDQRARDNFVLQDGDSVLVPSYNPVVRVVGAVNAPTAVAFVPGKNIDYYIRAAGGPARDADAGRAYVRQPNGKFESKRRRFFLLPTSVPEVRAGGEVTVPTRSAIDAAGAAQSIALFAQIAGTLAAVITAVAIYRRQ
jgi:protein involved in polysaccharide export with SLBB domain